MQHANLLQKCQHHDVLHPHTGSNTSIHPSARGDPQSTSFPNPSSTLQAVSTSKWHASSTRTSKHPPSISTMCTTQTPTIGTAPYLAVTSKNPFPARDWVPNLSTSRLILALASLIAVRANGVSGCLARSPGIAELFSTRWKWLKTCHKVLYNQNRFSDLPLIHLFS